MEHDWLFERCREVEASPDGHLDLWAREHYKSTIITVGKTIQDILASHGDDPLFDRPLTFGIFSHTRPIAKKFLRQIQRELETNRFLIELFPDVLWREPEREAPLWSLDAGIVLQRRNNPKEATVEAWGLVDSQPTSAHFDVLVYDDVVTEKSITTPEMMEKTTDAWGLSSNLGARGGVTRTIGTRYHFNDTYRAMIERGVVIPRIYPATDDGTPDGDPVLLTADELAEKRRKQGPYIFACQMLQNPKGDETQGFKPEWLRYYKNAPPLRSMNLYILVDPASEKKKTSDYTAAWVIGLAPDRNYYAIDIVRDRLNLTQRADLLFRWHRKYSPNAVAYEKYGKDSDIEHCNDRMSREHYRFELTSVAGALKKADRIKRLIPVFEQGRFWLPRSLHYTDYEGVTRDLVRDFVEQEYKGFPVPIHDDLLDSASRIFDLNAHFPKAKSTPKPRRRAAGGGNWMRN